MILHVTEATYIKDYQLKLKFNDGLEGVVDLSQELWGIMFESLKDKTMFSQVKLDKELDTIVWSNGADFAPEFLHALTQPAQENHHV